MNRSRDDLFALKQTSMSEFAFDDQVARVFDDMIQRSVPGYSTLLTGIAALTRKYAQNNTHCYDLGCSTGASMLAMHGALGNRGCKIIGVDNSTAMIERCRSDLQQAGLDIMIDIVCSDILDVSIENASVVVMNLTLQFIPLAKRQRCLETIYRGLLPGGILILSEKINFTDAHENQWQQSVHHGFKQLHGYSALEISQKRTALENVLIPETLETHRQRLINTGFRTIHSWFQCFNFISLAAIK
ncbi:MAG: carboxy-S-adenosyl-L-methionine synthase CmoA [Gammaproteobacteria bacterium]|nr:carboxy-S-adenosyl-L-methionine synthase CmoA [Gammaproteobacteria bacterium]